jgi:hypothetical protein
VLPAALSGLHGEIIGVCFDQAAELPRGELEDMIRFLSDLIHIHHSRGFTQRENPIKGAYIGASCGKYNQP